MQVAGPRVPPPRSQATIVLDQHNSALQLQSTSPRITQIQRQIHKYMHTKTPLSSFNNWYTSSISLVQFGRAASLAGVVHTSVVGVGVPDQSAPVLALCGTVLWHCVALCQQQHPSTTSTPAPSAASSEGRWSSARSSTRSSTRISARGRRASQHMTMQPEYTHTVLYALAHHFLCQHHQQPPSTTASEGLP